MRRWRKGGEEREGRGGEPQLMGERKREEGEERRGSGLIPRRVEVCKRVKCVH